MNVVAASPAHARDSRVDVPILVEEYLWKRVENPSIFLSNNGSIASGVTSNPEKPVPPVVMITSIFSSATQFWTVALIAVTLSLTMLLAAQLCPSASSIDCNNDPLLSSSRERVSEMARIAIFRGMNFFVLSKFSVNMVCFFIQREGQELPSPGLSFCPGAWP